MLSHLHSQGIRVLVISSWIIGFVVTTALPASAQKAQPPVVAAWQSAPASTALHIAVDVVLHLRASEDVDLVTAEVLPSDGIEVFASPVSWTGSLARDETLDIPVTARFIAEGDWTLGARITTLRGGATQVSGAVLNVVASSRVARLGSDPHALMKMSAPLSATDLALLGIGVEAPPGAAIFLPAVATTVAGTVQWRDPEGHTLPVRRAYVQISNAAGALLTTTGTSDTGTYSAAVNADSVKVTVFSRDVDNARVVIFPLGQPGQRYIIESAITPVTAANTTINLTTAATVRGAPGAPSNDSIAARAFAAYDAMLTFWFQATAILGRNMQQALANFPESTADTAQCGTSCYSQGNQQMYILRDDAFDWDVLGHEFFHFTTHRGATRTIDTSLGGYHSGGTAIGQNTKSDGTGRTRGRDEGMRLAWSEGLATSMALLLQIGPPSTFAFPGLLNVGDRNYQDTEDAQVTLSAETPSSSDGFGSENSVLGLFWDMYDSAQDSEPPITDTLAAVDGRLLWNLVNGILPCNPCDRVDKMWDAIVGMFGMTAPITMTVAKLFVLNEMAPKATAPAENASVPGSVAPTFTWARNGDPSAAHSNNRFILVFSRDDFQRHLVLIQVPTLGATSYKPTDAEWQSVQAGGDVGQVYKWMVVAERSDAPVVPAGWYWYSNVMSVVPRSLEATITWSPLGADVDLHLANPSGTDIAYYNKATSWGFLDRDCISTCTQEIISVTSLPLRGTYRLFAHYYNSHDKGAATVRAVVRSGSQVLVDTTFVLSGTGATRTLVSVAVPDARETTADAPPLPAEPKPIDAVLDPRVLPLKGPRP